MMSLIPFLAVAFFAPHLANAENLRGGRELFGVGGCVCGCPRVIKQRYSCNANQEPVDCSINTYGFWGCEEEHCTCRDLPPAPTPAPLVCDGSVVRRLYSCMDHQEPYDCSETCVEGNVLEETCSCRDGPIPPPPAQAVRLIKIPNQRLLQWTHSEDLQLVDPGDVGGIFSLESTYCPTHPAFAIQPDEWCVRIRHQDSGNIVTCAFNYNDIGRYVCGTTNTDDENTSRFVLRVSDWTNDWCEGCFSIRQVGNGNYITTHGNHIVTGLYETTWAKEAV